MLQNLACELLKFLHNSRMHRFCSSRQPMSGNENTAGGGKGNKDLNDLKVLKVVNHSWRSGEPFPGSPLRPE